MGRYRVGRYGVGRYGVGSYWVRGVGVGVGNYHNNCSAVEAARPSVTPKHIFGLTEILK